MSDYAEKDALTHYELQLHAVEESIKTATPEDLSELLDLKDKLAEVIILLGGKIRKASSEIQLVPASVSSSNSADDEFLRFQQEISQLEHTSDPEKKTVPSENSSDSEDENDMHNKFCSVLSSMEGNKCRAPFMREWGEKNYHNALIFSTDSAQLDLTNLQVKVMFCNPTCDQMKPCPFFLDGHCKFSDEKCRYSHGYDVKFADLREYVLPDFSNVQRDSRCLAKYKDGLWHHAVVESCLSNNKYSIKYTASKNTETLDAHDILPLDSLTLSDEDSSSESDSGEGFMYQPETANPANGNTSTEINYEAVSSGSAIGDWEQHTKGIGSKLMAKMGYVWGQGLGKNSDGRLEPVEAIVLPKGKSLDKCAELREYAGLESVEERFTAEQKKEEQRAKNIEQKEAPESSVFAFLNKNISARDVNAGSENTKKRQSLDASSSTNKARASDLNFELYSVGEAIKRTKKEIVKLQQSVNRNSDRNESTCSHMKQKMLVQTNLLKELEAKERRITNEISRKKNHKKISMF